MNIWWAFPILLLKLFDFVASDIPIGIIRGNEVPVGSAKWPFMVALLKLDEIKESKHRGIYEPFCGGSVVNENFILTAAHCLIYVTPIDVIVYMGNENILGLGDNRSLFGRPEKFILHSEFVHKVYHNDLALIKLKWPIDFDKYPNVKRSCLPSRIDESLVVKTNCYVMGWGLNGKGVFIHDDILHDLELPILDEETCRKCQPLTVPYIPEMMFCAGFVEGGKDACKGDSGGPLVCPHHKDNNLYVQYGIVSFGYGCALPDNPSYYVRVIHYLDWIQTVIVNES